MTAKRLNIWLEKMLLPKLPLGTTIVMDNATFHKTTKTKSLTWLTNPNHVNDFVLFVL